MKLQNHNNNRDIEFELVMLQHPELLKELSNSGHFPHRRQLWSELELLMLGYHVWLALYGFTPRECTYCKILVVSLALRVTSPVRIYPMWVNIVPKCMGKHQGVANPSPMSAKLHCFATITGVRDLFALCLEADRHEEIVVSKFERKKLAKVRTTFQKEKYFEKLVH